MEIYVPCKFGEKFQIYNFAGWKNGTRVYKKGPTDTFIGIDKYICETGSLLGAPAIHTNYLTCGYNKGLGLCEFVPKYVTDVPDYMFVDGILSGKGIGSKLTGHLWGLRLVKGTLIADFVCGPECSHTKFPYPLEIEYRPAEIRAEEIAQFVV